MPSPVEADLRGKIKAARVAAGKSIDRVNKAQEHLGEGVKKVVEAEGKKIVDPKVESKVRGRLIKETGKETSEQVMKEGSLGKAGTVPRGAGKGILKEEYLKDREYYHRLAEAILREKTAGYEGLGLSNKDIVQRNAMLENIQSYRAAGMAGGGLVEYLQRGGEKKKKKKVTGVFGRTAGGRTAEQRLGRVTRPSAGASARPRSSAERKYGPGFPTEVEAAIEGKRLRPTSEMNDRPLLFEKTPVSYTHLTLPTIYSV